MKLKMTGRRIAAGMLASAVSLLTFAVVAQAAQTITTPNVATFNYALAAGALSPPIPVPSNQPVFAMGVQTAVGFRGVGQVTLLSIPGAGGFLEWVGLESTAGSTITQGFSGVAGTHIVYLDFAHQVELEVNTISAAAAGTNTMRVANGAAGARSGRVTLMW